VDDDLGRRRGVEVRLLDGRHVVVDQVLRFLWILPGKEEELSSDGFRRGRQHVQVVERAVVMEATEVAVADNLLVSAVPNGEN
jgi:hypothetical protein